MKADDEADAFENYISYFNVTADLALHMKFHARIFKFHLSITLLTTSQKLMVVGLLLKYKYF